MRLLWLADVLRDAGLTVVEEPGWERRGADWSDGAPIGAMQHHTAPPVPFPPERLYPPGSGFGRIKANLCTQPDGTTHVIAAGRCNYSSGSGSGIVREETKRSIAPKGSARERGLWDTSNGNLYYINQETSHAGNGTTLPRRQEAALIRSWQAIFARLAWSPNRLIGHAEWTRRKIDPRWNGLDAHRNMNRLRSQVAGEPPDMGDEKDHYMFPIRRGDGTDEQRPERKQDIQYYQYRLKQVGVDAGTDGIADQKFLDAVFLFVGSPVGGSYFSGEEGAIFEQHMTERNTGLFSGDIVKLTKPGGK